MICITALKKQVLPRFCSPDPILLFCIGDYKLCFINFKKRSLEYYLLILFLMKS